MDALLRTLVAGLARGEVDARALEALGCADPARDGARLCAAAARPELAATRERWLPELLCSARPGAGAEYLAELAARVRPALELERLPLLPRLLGSSDALARLLLRHPNWSEELAGALPAAPAAEAVEADWTAIRIAKYKGLLRIAARDLAGRAFAESLAELSQLADRCLTAALARAAREAQVAPPALFALGKLGGNELNFSSDVDLLFIHESAPEGGAEPGQLARLIELIRCFKKHLEVPSEDGFGYRIDLDLRPEGRQGVIVNSVDAALAYYENFGADWERQMLIRLRFVAGARAPGQAFEQGLRPFVWRRTVGNDAVRAVRAMKRRIEDERLEAGRDLEADLKEGPGGIRDVEFLVQAFQLLFGGREPSLRTGNVLAALAALERAGLLDLSVTEELGDAYLWLRRAEHALQLADEQQTARVPARLEARVELARRMG
ncbi:MAG TPA: hypothetical protein VEI82_05515, partial [Myxococcota bacterium]|nr:hypothetical protein [Myxococcota bacterium]